MFHQYNAFVIYCNICTFLFSYTQAYSNTYPSAPVGTLFDNLDFPAP